MLLVADPHRAVRKGLARNYEMRNLSTDIVGLTVRKALLAVLTAQPLPVERMVADEPV